MSVCERCTENGNCAWQNHDETICREKPAFPATNADRIRAMTDEEMASFLSCIDTSWKPAYSRKDRDEWLDWLKQEATDG